MTKQDFKQSGFTLVELLVSMVVLAIIMLVAVQVITQTQKTWMQGNARIEQFREARMAFETITQSLRQATLNSYTTYRYNTSSTPTIPASKAETAQEYIRYSELQFLTDQAAVLFPGGGLKTHGIFFQAPLGITQRADYASLNKLLCSRGYFVMFGNDSAYRPAHITEDRVRYRLMEYRPPAEQNKIYDSIYGGAGNGWYSDAVAGVVSGSETVANYSATRPVAENIIALIVSPRVAPADVATTSTAPTWIAPNYAYDSRVVANTTSAAPQGTQHVLPPQVMITLVAIDEASARKLVERYGDTWPDFVPSTLFKNCNNYAADLRTVEENLIEEKVSYRVFSTTVGLRNSKFGVL